MTMQKSTEEFLFDIPYTDLYGSRKIKDLASAKTAKLEKNSLLTVLKST